MKKRINSIFLSMLAVFAFQGIFATSSSAQDQPTSVIYETAFKADDGGFTEQSESPVFKFNSGNVAAQVPVSATTTSYYISPEISLSKSGNFVAFDHSSQGLPDLKQRAALCIKEVGTDVWKEINIENWPAGTMWFFFTNTGEMPIPSEFNGQKVQIAFRFTADPETFEKNKGGNAINVKWAIKNFKVTKFIEREDAGLAFDKPEYTYYTGEIPFVQPTLINPNNLTVKYSIDNSSFDYARIDSYTGKLTILKPGKVVVYANSERTDAFNEGAASYILNIVDPSVIYTEPFGKKGFGQFYEEGEYNLWKHDGMINVCAHSVADAADYSMSYLVSPVITLGEANNQVVWDECGDGKMFDFDSQAKLYIREEGSTKWKNLIVYRNYLENEWETAYSNIPDTYNGKKVQVAFCFQMDVATDKTSSQYWCIWSIQNFAVKYDFQRIDPALAFDAETAKYVKGEEFTAPVLSNPENLDVVYSSSDVAVAEIDAKTGALKIVGEGVTTVTAESEENNKYLPGTASYELTVSFATDIEGVSINLENAKIYDLQGNRIQNVVKGGIYIINGKKILIKK